MPIFGIVLGFILWAMTRGGGGRAPSTGFRRDSSSTRSGTPVSLPSQIRWEDTKQ